MSQRESRVGVIVGKLEAGQELQVVRVVRPSGLRSVSAEVAVCAEARISRGRSTRSGFSRGHPAQITWSFGAEHVEAAAAVGIDELGGSRAVAVAPGGVRVEFRETGTRAGALMLQVCRSRGRWGGWAEKWPKLGTGKFWIRRSASIVATHQFLAAAESVARAPSIEKRGPASAPVDHASAAQLCGTRVQALVPVLALE